MDIFTVTFSGHRHLNRSIFVEEKLYKIITEILDKYDYVDFFVGRNGDFDLLATSCIRKAKRHFREDNNHLTLILPYKNRDFEKNKCSFETFYDSIEICEESSKAYFKSAISIRNKYMVKKSDLLICYVDSDFGGASKTLRYAKENHKEIINIADLI